MNLPTTFEELTLQTCAPLQHALSEAGIAALLPLLPEWTLQEGTLCRSYDFKNYYQTLAFVNALAAMVHEQDHHPELTITYNKCLVRYDTHSVDQGRGGLSENDFICAAKADAIYTGRQVEK